MRILRELLTATGGDVEELANWAAAVRDTDDDSAALSAYQARLEHRALMAQARADKALAAAQGREQAQILQNILREERKRPGPRRDRFIEIDTQVVRLAEVLEQHFPPKTPVKTLISEAVRRVNEVLTAFPASDIGHDALIYKSAWQALKPGAQPAVTTHWRPALGLSEQAAVARIFARLRRRSVKGGTIPADFGWSYLANRIQPRRRGVRKIGRRRSKSDPD